MKKLILISCVCMLLTAVAQANDYSNIIVSVTPWQYSPDAIELEVCHWVELSTDEGEQLSWLVHASEDIWDLHFGTWDDYTPLEAGQTPFSYSSSASEELGGPVGGTLPDPPPAPKYNWRTLNLWGSTTGGCPMPYCTYWLIQISRVPLDIEEVPLTPQNLWVHPTPEPATIALLCLGALSFIARKR